MNTSQHFCVVISSTLWWNPSVPVTPATHDVQEALAAIGSLKDEVQRVVRSLPNNKAFGTDMILAELWKAGCEVTCNELTLLLDWILRTGDVPAAWRGGRLARLFKGKGPTESTDSYRGLLIGDHTAKVCTGVLAPEVKKAIEQFLPPQQCGSTKGGGTNRGHHLVSTFVRPARKHKIPAAILFIDLFEVFDKLVRQVVFGISEARGDTNTIIDTLVKSGHGCRISPCTHHRFQRYTSSKSLRTSATWLADCMTTHGFRSNQEESSS